MTGIKKDKVLIQHYRVDQEFSNSFSLWKRFGSPQNPSEDQIKELEKAGQLHSYSSPEWEKTENTTITIKTTLPRQAVSLIRLTW